MPFFSVAIVFCFIKRLKNVVFKRIIINFYIKKQFFNIKKQEI